MQLNPIITGDTIRLILIVVMMMIVYEDVCMNQIFIKVTLIPLAVLCRNAVLPAAFVTNMAQTIFNH